jgi:hypothetical protein
MSHAAMPAPASTPNAKTAIPIITRAGVRDVKVLCVARICSAMGTRQRSRPLRNAQHVSCRQSSMADLAARPGQRLRRRASTARVDALSSRGAGCLQPRRRTDCRVE